MTPPIDKSGNPVSSLPCERCATVTAERDTARAALAEAEKARDFWHRDFDEARALAEDYKAKAERLDGAVTTRIVERDKAEEFALGLAMTRIGYEPGILRKENEGDEDNGDVCKECGADLYWNGGIMPSRCLLKIQSPEMHGQASRAYKRGLRDRKGLTYAAEARLAEAEAEIAQLKTKLEVCETKIGAAAIEPVKAVLQLATLRAAARAVLHADERGQGLPFAEAMNALLKALKEGGT